MRAPAYRQYQALQVPWSGSEKKDSKEKFSRLTIALHWLVGFTFIGLIAVGIYMEENEAFALYPIHKSVGVLVFAW